MVEPSELERICTFLLARPPQEWCYEPPDFSLAYGGFKFSLTRIDGTENHIAEGGMVLGKGESSVMVHDRPVTESFSRVFLNIKDFLTGHDIEVYEQKGDGLSGNYLDAQGRSNKRPLLLNFYTEIASKKDTYQKALNADRVQKEIAAGKEKLYALLQGHLG